MMELLFMLRLGLMASMFISVRRRELLVIGGIGEVGLSWGLLTMLRIFVSIDLIRL